jgi:RNA polymerase sigma-70 factor (ECF subfamily)
MNGAGKPLSVEDLAIQLARPVMGYLARYVGDQGVAEDLWQETLIRMHKGSSSFEGRSSAKTWAFAIATRVAADYLRRPGHDAGVVELAAVAEPVDPDRAIDEQLVIDEMNQCVRYVIDSLPEDYRSALILHDLEGLSAKQVAEVCDCSVASAKIRIHRARLRLREALNDECAFYHDADSVLRCESKRRIATSTGQSAEAGTALQRPQ